MLKHGVSQDNVHLNELNKESNQYSANELVGVKDSLESDGDLLVKRGGVPSRIARGNNGEVLTMYNNYPTWKKNNRIGDVVMTVLDSDNFYEEYSKTEWLACDGSNCRGTLYAKQTRNTVTPTVTLSGVTVYLKVN